MTIEQPKKELSPQDIETFLVNDYPQKGPDIITGLLLNFAGGHYTEEQVYSMSEKYLSHILNVDEYIDKKVIDLLFFRIGLDFRLDVFDQLKVILSAIDDKY